MTRALRVAPLLFLAFALVAARCDDPEATRNSGIDGTVMIGPMCPVAQADSPCPDQPYAATIVIEGTTGEEVTRTQSGGDGRFRVDLEPGSYTLVPQSPGSGLPYASVQDVEVAEGAYTHVEIQYDSGIR